MGFQIHGNAFAASNFGFGLCRWSELTIWMLKLDRVGFSGGSCPMDLMYRQ